MLGAGELVVDLAIHGIGELRGRGHEHGGGQGVVLRLADEVGRHVHGVGGVIGEHGDLGGPGLGVDADLTLEHALRRGHPDVAGPRHHVDGLATATARQVNAVGEHGDRLRAAGGVDLVDPEESARGQDRGVGQAIVICLGR